MYRKDKLRDDRRYAYRTPEYYERQGYNKETARELSRTSRHAHRSHH